MITPNDNRGEMPHLGDMAPNRIAAWGAGVTLAILTTGAALRGVLDPTDAQGQEPLPGLLTGPNTALGGPLSFPSATATEAAAGGNVAGQARSDTIKLATQIVDLAKRAKTGQAPGVEFSLLGTDTVDLDEVSVIIRGIPGAGIDNRSSDMFYAKIPAPAGDTTHRLKPNDLFRLDPTKARSVILNAGSNVQLTFQGNAPSSGGQTVRGNYLSGSDLNQRFTVIEASTKPVKGEQRLTAGKLRSFYAKAKQVILAGKNHVQLPPSGLQPAFPPVKGEKNPAMPII